MRLLPYLSTNERVHNAMLKMSNSKLNSCFSTECPKSIVHLYIKNLYIECARLLGCIVEFLNIKRIFNMSKVLEILSFEA